MPLRAEAAGATRARAAARAAALFFAAATHVPASFAGDAPAPSSAVSAAASAARSARHRRGRSGRVGRARRSRSRRLAQGAHLALSRPAQARRSAGRRSIRSGSASPAGSPKADAGLVWLLGAIALAVALVAARRWLAVHGEAVHARGARLPSHVRELDIRPESLPDDIGAAVRALWLAGERRAALSLLYRGTLSRLVHSYDDRDRRREHRRRLRPPRARRAAARPERLRRRARRCLAARGLRRSPARDRRRAAPVRRLRSAASRASRPAEGASRHEPPHPLVAGRAGGGAHRRARRVARPVDRMGRRHGADPAARRGGARSRSTPPSSSRAVSAPRSSPSATSSSCRRTARRSSSRRGAGTCFPAATPRSSAGSRDGGHLVAHAERVVGRRRCADVGADPQPSRRAARDQAASQAASAAARLGRGPARRIPAAPRSCVQASSSEPAGAGGAFGAPRGYRVCGTRLADRARTFGDMDSCRRRRRGRRAGALTAAATSRATRSKDRSRTARWCATTARLRSRRSLQLRPGDGSGSSPRRRARG